VKGYIDDASFEDGSFDVVISNGVINLALAKPQVFREISRLQRPGWRDETELATALCGQRGLGHGLRYSWFEWARLLGGSRPRVPTRACGRGRGHGPWASESCPVAEEPRAYARSDPEMIVLGSTHLPMMPCTVRLRSKALGTKIQAETHPTRQHIVVG
jgi:SAM-dependent methyltransferase